MHAEERFLQFVHHLGLHRGGHGEQSRVTPQDHDNAHQLYQVSTLNAVMQGVYDGHLSFADLRRHGDFGLGTFNALDGEMVAVDGEYFQVKGDGAVLAVDDALLTPFAVVQFFQPEKQWVIENPIRYAELPDRFTDLAASENYFYAVRFDGLFSYVRTRSVPRQRQPYPPLSEAVKQQTVFEFTNIEGSVVGFRFPDYTQGINMPGFHLHFISIDRTAGGHVLDFTLESGVCSVEHTSDFYMELPENAAFHQADLAKDQRAETESAEH